MQLAAGPYVYRPLRLGISGWDCWALQKDLGGIVADGSFGPQTLAAVKAFQKKIFTDPDDHDGIAGVKTQVEVAKSMIWPVQNSMSIPKGILRGLIEGESAFWLGNHTGTYPNGTRDLGLCMFNMQPSDSAFRFAFDGRVAIQSTGSRLKGRHDYYLQRSDRDDFDIPAWRYAVLYHNWQSAADRYADGTIKTWSYKSRGVWYTMDQPAPWVEELGVAGVRTGYDWAQYYCDGKLIYATAIQGDL